VTSRYAHESHSGGNRPPARRKFPSQFGTVKIRRPRRISAVGVAVSASAAIVATMLSVGPAQAAPTVLAADSLSRSVGSGWGAAETGGTYTISGAGQFKVNGSYGTMDLAAAGASASATLSSVNAADQIARVSIAVAALPTAGNGVYNSIVLRHKAGYGYRALLRIQPGGTARLSIDRIDGSPSALTTVSSEVTLPTKVSAGQWYTVAFATTGSSAVNLQAKAWPTSAAEPGWLIATTDSSAARVASAGSLQLTSYTSRSSGGAQVWYDNLQVITSDTGAAPITSSSSTTSSSPRPTTSTPTPTQSSTPRPTTSTPTSTSTPPPTTSTATVAPTATTTSSAAPPTTAPPASGGNGSVGSSGSIAVGSARYTAPSSAIYVSPSGSDSAAGSSSAPMKTVSAAINRATSGATIVLRAGTYHESVTISKTLTIQNYPGEAVWFEGSSAVSNFVKSGTTWRLDGWTAEFDASQTYTFGAPPSSEANWGFVNPSYPMASHPDQVWIDGVAQKQASSLAGVQPGWFYVDYAANRLHLGSDPTGKSVRASDLATAISIRSSGSVLRGVGVRRYAPSIPHMGTVIAERTGITIENVVVSDNATTGLSLLAANITVNGVTSLRNGLLGIHGNQADNIVLTNVQANGNNTENFNQAPVSGGVKITRTRGITIKNSSFDNNRGPGIWLDESTYDSKVVNSTSRGNTGHGISVEISGKSILANNYITNNAGFGMKINDVNDIKIWNNTLVDNGRPVNIVQDNRRASNLSTPGHDPRQKLPDPTVTWITGPVDVRNNVISGTTGNCLLCVEDYSNEFSAEQMKVTAIGNVYQRDRTTQPSWLAVWSRGAGNPAVFTSLAAFKSGTGQEARSFSLDGTEAIGTDGRITSPVVAQVAAVSQSLPSDLASLTGRPAGTKQLGVIW
jgi:parallel beta-helix repeat protein